MTSAELIYNGCSGERQALQQLIDSSQKNMTGRLPEDSAGSYDHQDAAGFICLNVNALRFLYQKQEEETGEIEET